MYYIMYRWPFLFGFWNNSIQYWLEVFTFFPSLLIHSYEETLSLVWESVVLQDLHGTYLVPISMFDCFWGLFSNKKSKKKKDDIDNNLNIGWWYKDYDDYDDEDDHALLTWLIWASFEGVNTELH